MKKTIKFKTISIKIKFHLKLSFEIDFIVQKIKGYVNVALIFHRK